eukprot:477853_1
MAQIRLRKFKFFKEILKHPILWNYSLLSNQFFILYIGIVCNVFWCANANTYCANVAIGCDNAATIYRHDTNGVIDITQNLIQITHGGFVVAVEDITSNTKLEFQCESIGGYGAFIATINFGGTFYSTKNPISSTNFNVIQGSSGSYCYGSKTWHPWWRFNEYIASDANTIWISCGSNMGWNVAGTMRFMFDFALIPFNTPDTSFSCVSQSPTNAPTQSPTTHRQLFTSTTTLVTWDEAEAYCNSIGSNLASIHSVTDRDTVYQACGFSNCWAGLFRETVNSKWTWTDGSAAEYGFDVNGDATTGVSPWSANEPNNYNNWGEHCGMINGGNYRVPLLS